VVTVAGDDTGERGQIYTLESLTAALILLAAFLFALQSTIVTPTTTSAVDPEVRADIRAQADDVLAVTAENGTTDLSWYVRLWDQNTRTFAGGQNPDVGYGASEPPGVLGRVLGATFTDRARTYNVDVYYAKPDLSAGRGRLRMVYRGTPGEGAVVASRTVVLYDNQTLTAPRAGNAELWEYGTEIAGDDDGYYPIPNAVDGPVYNVVEVRITVW
jgi:hypothetical protein